MIATELVRDMESLRLLLRWLDGRIQHSVGSFREELAERARDPFRGLYITDADVDAMLASAGVDGGHALLPVAVAGSSSRLARLAELFSLDELDKQALIVALAPEVDLRYERLYGYLQDDVTRRRPSVNLVLQLLTGEQARTEARQRLGPSGLLLREGLLCVADKAALRWPLLSRPLRVDERIVEYLLGSDLPDPRLAGLAELQAADGVSPEEAPSELVRVIDRAPIVYLHGPFGSGKITAAGAACAAADIRLLHVSVSALLDLDQPAIGLRWAVHEAMLQDAAVAIDGFDRLLASDDRDAHLGYELRRLVTSLRQPVFLFGETLWEPAAWWPDELAVRVAIGSMSRAARVELWREQLDGHLDSTEASRLARRFRLGRDGIRAVAAAARGRAFIRGDEVAQSGDFEAAARAIAGPQLVGLATHIQPRYGWEDIVLPADGLAQLRELCARAHNLATVLDDWGFGRKHVRRAGLTALFAGPPGTGKTMAAEILAGDLGLDVYRIDLSAVVSKYIGETEKNLERIFRAADSGDAVLLFDEADALFGKRSEVRDAHDRYANVEIAYLLQRLEAYEGLAILTTNMRGNLDEAFARRLDAVLEFPQPDEAERLAIWRRALPPEAPLASDVDLSFLAQRFKLAGGHIRNIALTAAVLAVADSEPIGMGHLARATRREYQKLGKLVAENDFGAYYELLKDGADNGSNGRKAARPSQSR